MAIECPTCHSENTETSRFCADCGTQLPPPHDHPPLMTETLQTPARELTTGSTFAGRYQVIEELGHGGMGKVYRVLDKKLNEEVGLKLIKPEIASEKKTLERFSNELKIARKIVHKNVGRMYHLSEEKGTYYLTMEYVPGEDLRSMIRMSRRLEVGTAISIAKQVCEGLAEAHRLGVIHRDLKPSNIMIDKEGDARIMDFGIARSLHVKSITAEGVIIGTPEYMSPEQVEGKEVDQRSDIYSLGIILYEMVTGRVPFEGDTPFTIGMKHKSEIPKDPRELNNQIPHDLSGLILRCMEKDKGKRYQNAGELLADLAKIEDGIPTAERAIPKRRPFTSKEITVQFSLKKVFVPVLAVVAVAVIALVIWKTIPRKEAILGPKIKNSIAVISFENQTGDKAYDYLQKAIPNLLITSLEQTGVHYIATWERLHDLLKQMGKGDIEIIDKDLGFELCRREGIGAIVLGSFIKAGNMFATDVKVLDVETKKLLKSASTRGEGADSILKAQIDKLSQDVAQAIGLTEKKMEANQKKVAEVTTSSMEAYNCYIRGLEELGRWHWDVARRYLEKAVQLDPEFAAAYLDLAWLHQYLGNTKARDEAVEKAKVFSTKATEKERLWVEACYARWIEKNPGKYFRILGDAGKKYPKEKIIYFNLGDYFQNVVKNYEKAIDQYNKALELDPDYLAPIIYLTTANIELKNYKKAMELLERWATLSPGDPNSIDTMSWVNFLKYRRKSPDVSPWME